MRNRFVSEEEKCKYQKYVRLKQVKGEVPEPPERWRDIVETAK